MKGISDPLWVRSRSSGLIGRAVEVDDAGRVLVDFDAGMLRWIPLEDLVYQGKVWFVPEAIEDEILSEPKQALKEGMDRHMREIMSIKEPIGMPFVNKKVKLIIGEGDEKIEIGEARIDSIPNGDMMVELIITNQKIAELLGGNQINGIIPRSVEIPPIAKENTDE